MPEDDTGEDNRFASVAETLEDADAEDVGREEGLEDIDSEDAENRDREEGTDSGDSQSRPGRPFPFREVAQYPFYARKRSWAVAEETRADVESSLRERGIADVRKREFHDALLRVAAADPEAVADAIVSARTED
jgi:hypothetical protein